jgi:uncharacterized membrane protein
MTISAVAWPILAIAILLQISYPLVDGHARSQLSVVIVVTMAAAGALGIAACYGIPRAAAACALSAGIGFVAEVIGTSTGYPFGSYDYTGGLGPGIAGVPIVVGLAWTMGALPAAAAAARLARARGRIVRAAITAAALGAWDLFLDPQMVSDGRWRWADPSPHLPGVPGVPLTNYAGWAVVACAVGTAVTAALGPPPSGARDVSRPVARLAPAEAQFLWVYASSVLAHAVFLDLPGSAVWGALGMGAVAWPLAIAVHRDTTVHRDGSVHWALAARPESAGPRARR